MKRGFMSAWLDQRIAAIHICMGAGFADAVLALLYSAIDTLAFLSAPAKAKKAERRYFINWCNRYMVPFLHSAATGIDLYGARCGVLHTSSAASELGCEGKAREVWYRFEGRVGVNLMTNTPRPALMLDIEALVDAFGKGSQQFVADLECDPAQRAIAQERAGQFFRWGILRTARAR
jgi:hypothetical protein